MLTPTTTWATYIRIRYQYTNKRCNRWIRMVEDSHQPTIGYEWQRRLLKSSTRKQLIMPLQFVLGFSQGQVFVGHNTTLTAGEGSEMWCEYWMEEKARIWESLPVSLSGYKLINRKAIRYTRGECTLFTNFHCPFVDKLLTTRADRRHVR